VSHPIVAGFQRWRALLFVHWEVPAATLRALVPASLEIDTFENRAYVGLIPFAIPEARPPSPLPPVPTAARFLETNLRTYVKANGQPGIWFFSLEAASTLAVLGARAAYGLPYFRAQMSSTAGDGGSTVIENQQIRYRSHRQWPGPRPADLQIDYSVGAPMGTAVAGTLTHFLIERYTLFVQRRALGLMRANVRHEPYPLQQATVHAVNESLTRAAGLLALGRRAPDLFSPGVDVDILAPERVR
jgi:uncharacterized protein YqjF (DUF2071 family)